MRNLPLTEVYEKLLQESLLVETPFNDINDIKSTRFTASHPKGSKFKPGDKVKLRNLTDVHFDVSHPALRKFGPNAPGTVKGMQLNTGTGMTNPQNRYYVKMDEDGKIYPIPSQYLTLVQSNPKAKAGDPERVPVTDAGRGEYRAVQSAARKREAQKFFAGLEAKKALPKQMETVIEAADLGDLIHVLREYVKTLTPEQDKAMAEFFMDRIRPEEGIPVEDDSVPSGPKGPKATSPFGPEYRNVLGYKPGNKHQDENYRSVQHRGY